MSKTDDESQQVTEQNLKKVKLDGQLNQQLHLEVKTAANACFLILVIDMN